jgi:hypothetical protein
MEKERNGTNGETAKEKKLIMRKKIIVQNGSISETSFCQNALESGAKLSVGSKGFLASFLLYEQPELCALERNESLI